MQADEAGLRGGAQQLLVMGEWITIGGDIIIAINETRITSLDGLSAYLEEYTLPGQTINLAAVRDDQRMSCVVALGTRPPPGAP